MVPMVPDNLMVFTGNANPKLAQAVAAHLNIPLGKAVVSHFSDGEVMVEIDEKVRGRDVFILQSTCSPTNDNLMELTIMVDALRRASAGLSRCRGDRCDAGADRLERLHFCYDLFARLSEFIVRVVSVR